LLTLTLQTVTAVLKLIFVGIAILIVRRHAEPVSPPGAAWRWIAISFLVSGISGLFQSLWAVRAYVSGPGSEVYARYLAWMPAMNYSRYAIVFLLAGILILLAFGRVPPRVLRPGVILTLCVAAALVGAMAGLREGAFAPGVHAARLAELQVVEMLLLLAALFAAVVFGSMDAWLWMTVLVYALRQSFNTLLWAAHAAGAVDGAWNPPFWMGAAVGCVAWLGMIALALGWLRRARQGRPVSIIFSSDRSTH
jgi:hypothetical protein